MGWMVHRVVTPNAIRRQERVNALVGVAEEDQPPVLRNQLQEFQRYSPSGLTPMKSASSRGSR